MGISEILVSDAFLISQRLNPDMTDFRKVRQYTCFVVFSHEQTGCVFRFATRYDWDWQQEDKKIHKPVKSLLMHNVHNVNAFCPLWQLMEIAVTAKLNLHFHGQMSWHSVPWYLGVLASLPWTRRHFLDYG